MTKFYLIKFQSYLIYDIVNKLCFCIRDTVRRPIALTLLRGQTVRPFVAALAPAAVETEVMDHVMETVKETRSEPQRVEHRIKEAGVAEIAERGHRRCLWRL